MKRLSLVRASLLALLVIFPLLESYAWLAPPVWRHAAGALALVATLMGSPAPQQPMLGKELQASLQKPTEERPQIQIPSNLQQTTSEVDKIAPIVEGTIELCVLAQTKHHHLSMILYLHSFSTL